MKRNYLFFWFAVLFLLFTSAQSYAEVYSGSCGESVNWSLDTETGLLEITGSGKIADYSVGHAPWYNCRTNIKECVIENGVTSIGKYAFSSCSGLTNITIPESVIIIGSSAFRNCTGLTSVTIPNSVTSIGDGAFSGCTGLTSVTIPNSVTSIGDGAFYGCTGLTSINVDKNNPNYCSQNAVLFTKDMKSIICVPAGKTGDYSIPNSVTSIGVGEFQYCTGLTSITIPESVTSIGDNAFYGCTGLTSINVDKNNPNYCSQNGVLFTKDMKSINCVPAGKTGDYSIPNSVTSIGVCAFLYCTGLTSITIPESVTSIGGSAFRYCTGLTSITWNAISCTSFNSSTFNGTKENITSFTFGDKVQTIPARICSKMSNLTNITIGNSVTSIGSYAFDGCTGLTSVTIPESVTSIGSNAFYGCTGLTSITIPESLTSIEEGAFDGCTGLTSITWNAISCTSFNSSTFDGIKENITSFTFGDKVQTIPARICSEMSNLTNITIGNSVTSIGVNAFYGTPWLNNQSDGLIYIGKVCYDYKGEMPENTTIIIKEGTTSIGYRAFYGCTGLTNITIPESVTSIGEEAFSGCTGLTSITIPESVTSIGYRSFYRCTGLTSVTIGNSVTSIGDYAFYKCTGLTSITIGNSVTSIGEYAFSGCTGLTNITIPNSVTSIGKFAFDGCTGLTAVIMGEGVTSIGMRAFANNSNLVSITCYSQTSPEAGQFAFRGISKEAILYYPKGCDYSAWAPYFAQMIEMDETDIDTPKVNDSKNTTYDIYDMSGRMVRKGTTTTDGLKSGLYIINGRKVLVE